MHEVITVRFVYSKRIRITLNLKVLNIYSISISQAVKGSQSPCACVNQRVSTQSLLTPRHAKSVGLMSTRAQRVQWDGIGLYR